LDDPVRRKRDRVGDPVGEGQRERSEQGRAAVEAGITKLRSAGCAINDYADRSFDPKVARTKDRPLAAGRISTLEALVLFGSITGRDPRSLGANECSGFELGLSGAQVGALQQVAFDQLAAEGTLHTAAAKPEAKAPSPTRCGASR